MNKGVIFDMDGTLWDSAENVATSWNLAIEQSGLSGIVITKEDMYRVMGKTMDAIADMLFPDILGSDRELLLSNCYRLENEYLRKHGGTLYPDIRKTLEQLNKEYHLYIVSNCQAGYIELMLEKTGFGKYIKDHVCPGDTNMLKAENILLIAERNGLKNPIYVGDTHMDAEACVKAGVPIIFASYGFGKVEKPDYVIDTPMDLVSLFGLED